MDYKNTRFTFTLSNRPDRFYAVTMTNGDLTIMDNDDELEGQIVDLIQGIIGYFEDHGASGDELIQLITNNVLLRFNIEDMLPHDPGLKKLVEAFGLRTIYPNGINLPYNTF